MKNRNYIFWTFAFMLFSSLSFAQCPFIEEVRLWDNSWNNPSGHSQGNYADYTNDCIPLFETQYTQINITASQGNVYMAMYADLDGNGSFETQIFNFLDANGGTGVNPTSIVQHGTPIRVIVSDSPIISGDVIPTCGEAEDYVICEEVKDCPFITEVKVWDNSWANPTGQSPTNYEDYTSNCVPALDASPTQINVALSHPNMYRAVYADLDGNGTFEYQITNQLDVNGFFNFNVLNFPPGTPIRIIVSIDPIPSGDVIPECGEVEDYELCDEEKDCPFITEVKVWDNSWANPTGQSPTNYEDYTSNCVPALDASPTQINVALSHPNMYRAVYADLDGNGTFEYQITNQLDVNGFFNFNVLNFPPGTPIRIIVSIDPIPSGDVIPECGEVEDYELCEEEKDCPFITEVKVWDNSWANPTGQSPTNYEDYTSNCVPALDASPTQINVALSHPNMYRAVYADLDGNGTFEYQITNQLDVNGFFNFNVLNFPPGTPIRIIVSIDPIPSGDVIPECGEVEDYVLCHQDCDCVNGGDIYTWNGSNCSIGFWLGGFGVDGCATIQPGFTWNFGDNSPPVTTSNNWTYYTYANPGTYTVTVSFVVVNNATGQPCTQTYTTTIEVDECGKEGKSAFTFTPPTEAINVNAYPNPAEDFVTISIDGISSMDEIENKELTIFDHLGREVYRTSFDTNEKTIDFRTIGSGYFIYRITQNGELIGDGGLVVK